MTISFTVDTTSLKSNANHPIRAEHSHGSRLLFLGEMRGNGQREDPDRRPGGICLCLGLGQLSGPGLWTREAVPEVSLFVWIISNTSSCRAHNAMDPSLYCKDSDKIVYQVHLETAVMIQVRQFSTDFMWFYWSNPLKDFIKNYLISRLLGQMGELLSVTSGTLMGLMNSSWSLMYTRISLQHRI